MSRLEVLREVDRCVYASHPKNPDVEEVVN
jgi:hypothetical protein